MEDLARPAQEEPIAFTCVGSTLGPLYLGYTRMGICFVSLTAQGDAAFVHEIGERHGPQAAATARRDDTRRADLEGQVALFFQGRDQEVPLDLSRVTAFQRRVMLEVRRIPRGAVRSYGWIAEQIGQPRAARAVGSTMARNPVPLFIPCHRVVPKGGGLGNYSGGGPEIKRHLLTLEGALRER